jgi:hypothetical protein
MQLVDQGSRATRTDIPPYHEGLNHFARVPGLVRRARALADPVHRDLSESRNLQSAASRLRLEMLDWYIRTGIASKRSLQNTSSNRSDVTSYYHYDNSTTASFAVHHSAYLILVNNILDLLSGYCSHRDANTDLASQISLSASYNFRTGFCGAQALTVALPIALTAVPRDHPLYEDILKWLERLDDSNMAIKWNATLSEESR